MAAQQGKLTTQSVEDTPEPTISKEEALKVFAKQKDKSLAHVKTVATRTRAEQDKIDKMDAYEKQVDTMVEQCKMHDEMYYETGVENEVFEAALLYYVLQGDPVFEAKMEEYNKVVQSELEAGGQE